MRLLFCTALAALATCPATAQERTLWDLLHPDRLIERAIGFGVVALRSRMDVTYSALSVAALRGAVRIDDLRLTLYDNLTGGDVCAIDVDGVEIRTGDPFEPARSQLRVAAQGLRIDGDCLPRDLRPALAMLGRTDIAVPDLSVEVTYDLPSAAAGLAVAATAEGIAAATFDVTFAYVAMWGGDDPEGTPVLVGDLSRATLSVENLGGWERAAPLVPADFADPERAGAAMAGLVGGLLEEQARGGLLSKRVRAFAVEAAQGWAAFVADPRRIVVETGYPAGEYRVIEPTAFENGPLGLIDLLEPVVRPAPAAAAATLEPGLLRTALNAPDTLSPEDRRAAGLALLTGEGVPRATARGAALLEGLEMPGDGAVMLALARARMEGDPEGAYAAALAAGDSGMPGTRALLDRIEDGLPFGARLRLQAEAAGPLPEADTLPEGAAALRARAEAHLSGIGAPRSLRHAAFLASLAAAGGDGAAQRLVSRIDASIPEGAEGWREAEAEVAAAALAVWLAGR